MFLTVIAILDLQYYTRMEPDEDLHSPSVFARCDVGGWILLLEFVVVTPNDLLTLGSVGNSGVSNTHRRG